MDVLKWSAPFLADCISQMFYAMLSQHNEIYDKDEESAKLDEPLEIKGEINNLL